MSPLADKYKLWLDRYENEKNDKAKARFYQQLNGIHEELLELDTKAILEIHAEFRKSKVDEKIVKNDVQKMETLNENVEIIDDKILENYKQEIDKIKRVFKYKMIDAETSEYLKELEDKVNKYSLEQKKTVSLTNVKYKTENGEIFFFNRINQTAYFENGVEYQKDELETLLKNNTTHTGFEAIHYLKTNFNAKYVNI